MASKKKYSYDLRERVIKHYLDGDLVCKISQKVLILRDSVHYMIVNYELTKCIGNIIDRRQKRQTTTHTDSAVQRKIKIDGQKSAPSIIAELNIIISKSTISRKQICMVMLLLKKPVYKQDKS